MARGEDDPGDARVSSEQLRTLTAYPGLLTFDSDNDEAFLEVLSSDSAGSASQTPGSMPAPPASASPRQQIENFRFVDILGWLQRNSIYVVSSILVCRQDTHVASLSRFVVLTLACRSLGAVLLLSASSAPCLSPDDALYLNTFETRNV